MCFYLKCFENDSDLGISKNVTVLYTEIGTPESQLIPIYKTLMVELLDTSK